MGCSSASPADVSAASRSAAAGGGGSGAAAAAGGSATGAAASGGSSGAVGRGLSGTSTGGGSSGAIGSSGSSGVGGGLSGGVSSGNGGSGTGGSGGAGSVGGADGGASGNAADGGGSGPTADAGVNFVPAGYKGTPSKALKIPGTIYAADYDRGGPTVAFCRAGASCTDGIVTGDWAPANTPPYRPPVPATAKICSGAACDENVGLCRMNPAKPDHTLAGQPVMPVDTYVCYSTAGEWLKYTVQVTEAGVYAVGGFMAVPMGGGVNLSFGSGITTGNIALPLSPTTQCACSEYFHAWAQRDNLATVTFPAAGTYLMTLTQVGRFNADNFTFTKM